MKDVFEINTDLTQSVVIRRDPVIVEVKQDGDHVSIGILVRPGSSITSSQVAYADNQLSMKQYQIPGQFCIETVRINVEPDNKPIAKRGMHVPK